MTDGIIGPNPCDVCGAQYGHYTGCKTLKMEQAEVSMLNLIEKIRGLEAELHKARERIRELEATQIREPVTAYDQAKWDRITELMTEIVGEQ